jgi:phosphoserine phosphatase RsbU/P
MNLSLGFRKLKHRLIAYVIIAVTPLIILNTLSQNVAWESRKEAVLDNSMRVATTTADAVDNFLVNTEDMLRTSAVALATNAIPPGESRAYLEKLRSYNEHILGLVVTDARGNEIADDPPGYEGPASSEEEALRHVMSNHKLDYVSNVFLDKPTGQKVFWVCTAIRDKGKLKLIILCAMDPAALTEIGGPQAAPPATIGVVDSVGNVIVSNMPQAQKSNHLINRLYVPSVRPALNGKRATVESWRDPMDGLVKLGAAAPVKHSGWAAGDMYVEDIAFKPFVDSQRRDLLTLLAFALVSIFFAFFFGNHVTKGLECLSGHTARLAVGDLSSRCDIRRDDEIGQLVDSFNRMAINLQAFHNVARAATSIVNTEALFQSIVSEVAAATGFDICGIGIVPEDRGSIAFVAMHGAWNEDWRDLRIPIGNGACGAAVEKGETVVDMFTGESDDICRSVLASERVCFVAATPIMSESTTIGVLAVYSRTARTFAERDSSLLSTMASLAAVGTRNAQAYQREHTIAETLQRSFMPLIPSGVHDFEVAHEYIPAMKEAELGGDFYDFFRIDDRHYGIVIGDVAGKGLSAAVDAVMTKYILRAYVSEDKDPPSALARLNNALSGTVDPGSFVTLVYGILDVDVGSLVFSCAGHEPPALYLAELNKVQFHKPSGRAAGVFPNENYGVDEIHFKEGDCLLLYTDGVSEARRNGGFFGDSGITKGMARCSSEPSTQRLLDLLLQDILDYAKGRARDDIAMLAIRKVNNS